MSKITCLTCAYNAEKTLNRTITSILDQTFTDINYIIIDHGSTDKTRDIICEFEKKDNRIKGIYYDVNKSVCGASSYLFNHMISEINNTSWFIIVDSDDEYKKEAFEDMLTFAEKGNFDLVCCGSDFFDVESGTIVGKRLLPKPMIVKSKDEFEQYFIFYHQFMRTHWGKLISSKAISQCDFSWLSNDIYYDTAFSFEILKHIDSFGIINESLHNYYLSISSSSYRIEKSVEGKKEFKLLANNRIFDFVCDFLVNKTGELSESNTMFMLEVYVNSLRDTLYAYCKSEIDNSKKLELICDMFLCDHVNYLATYNNINMDINQNHLNDNRKNLFTETLGWIESLSEIEDENIENYYKLGEFLSTANEDLSKFISFRTKRINYYFKKKCYNEAASLAKELIEIYD